MSERRIDIELAERPLQDGMTAIAIRNPGVSTTAIGASFYTGQLDEPDDQPGIASLMGACLEEGTEALGAVGLAEAVESIGGSLSSSETGARIQCPADQVEAAADLVRDVALRPGFRPEDVARIQRETIAEIEADLAEPSMVAGQRFRREVYGAHPYGRPSYGTRESVESFTPDALRGFHAAAFRPAKAFVVVAGPFELERSLDLLERTFGDFRGEPGAVREHAAPEMPEVSRQIHLPMKREQVHVYLGHPGIRRGDPDFYSLLVMDNVLGSGAGFTARIPKKLRDELGLCYSVGASITGNAGEEVGTFRAYIGTSAEHRHRAIDGFLEEIESVRREVPTADEVHVAQEALAGGFVLGLERNANLMSFAVRTQRYGLGFDYLREFPGLVRGITAEDVRRVAEIHLHPDRVVVVSAGAG